MYKALLLVVALSARVTENVVIHGAQKTICFPTPRVGVSSGIVTSEPVQTHLPASPDLRTAVSYSVFLLLFNKGGEN